MAQNVQLPDGTFFPMKAGESPEQALMAAATLYPDAFKTQAQAPAATPQTGFVPSVKRGFAQTGMLLGDILPAMAARAVGADEYANRQLAEAAATQKQIEEKYPSAVPSFTDIKGVGDAVTYITEAVGESIPSLIPSLFTGGAAALLARPATAAAMEAAKRVATQQVAQATARGVLTDEALNVIKKEALDQGVKAAQRVALRYEAAGAVAGSAVQNVPEVYQSVLQETGKEDLGAALVGGGFNAVLDALTPLNILRKARSSGIPSQEIIGAWYKRAGKGAVEGLLTEGTTEAVQEMSSAAATKFVDENKDFFTQENFNKFINAGLRGGIGGAAVTSGTNVAFGTKEGQAAVQAREEEARRAEAQAEAARTTPEALRQLDDQFQTLRQQKQQLDAQLKAMKPPKGADDATKQAYQEAKTRRDEFVKTQFAPVAQEYAKRRGAIEQMYTDQQTQIETEAAAEQPTAARPLPSDIPEAQPYQLSPVVRLMDQLDMVRKQHDALTTRLSNASVEEQEALDAQRQQYEALMAELSQSIEQRGGVADTQPEFEKRLQAAEKERQKLLTQGDWQGAAKKLAEVKDLQTRAPMFEELRLSREQAGQTRELFAEEPAQPEEKGLQYVSPTGKPVPIVAEKPEEAVALTPPKQEELARVSRAQQTVNTAQADLDTAVKSAQERTKAGVPAVAQLAQRQIYSAIDKLNEAQNAADRAQEDVGRPTFKPAIVDIFDPANVLQEALRNGDTKLLADLARQADRATLTKALDEKATERDRLVNALESRLDLGGAGLTKKKVAGERRPLRSVKRERANLFDQIYDPSTKEGAEAQGAFKNGTYLGVIERQKENIVKRPRVDQFGRPVLDREGKRVVDEVREPVVDKKGYPVMEKVKLQDIYDQGGTAAVEYEWVLDKIFPLMRKVTTPQGNAKQSLYEQLVRTYAELEDLKARKESGIAAPTMREKAAALQAQLGKGEAPAERQMDASERHNLERKLKTTQNKYDELVGKITPIRDQILALHNRLYETTPLEKPSEIEKKKRTEAEAAALAPKTMSRAAATAKRITSGNVRKEAEASEKMRALALELGMNEPAFKKYEKSATAKMTKMEETLGFDDPKVAAFRRELADEYTAKAMEFGRATPEYKATLKEQIAYFKEVLATTGKQEVATKRTGAVTRKQTAAPSRLVSASPESKAASKREQEAFARYRGSMRDVQEALASEQEGPMDFDGDTVFRKRSERAEGAVDAAEAQKVIDGLKLPENVKFVYAPTAGDIPVKLLRQMAREGVDPTDGIVQGAVFSDGTVLVVGDQHASVADLEETIAHEIVGHYGIDTLIGTERLNKFAQDTDVIKLAEEIGGKPLVAEVMATVRANAELGRSEEVQKLQALREIIAHTEEARVTESFLKKANRWLKELVGMVRAGLRDMGFTSLPRLSTSDVFYMLKKSRKAFASGKIGPYRAADGEIAFRRQRAKSESVVAQEPGFADKFFGNFFGLAGRVQMVDRWAALRESVKAGMKQGVISDLEAQNAEYLMNYGSQVSQYSQQFLITGPLKAEITKKNGVTQTIFRSTKGVTLSDVAQKVSEAKLASPSEQENMFTVYLAGPRAESVGWDKLNFKEPAKARAEYNAVLAKLEANPTAKKAFEDAKKLYQEYNAGLLDWLVQTGVMTPQKAAELKAITYVPYYRVNKNGEVQLMIDKETPVRISNIKDEPQLQALVGGNEAIMPVFTSAVQNTYMITNMGLRNQTVKETAFLLQKLGVASRLSEGKGPVGDDVVRFKKNGKDYYVKIDNDLYGIPADLIVKGMEGIKTTIPAVVRLMGYPADILRKFVTRMPPYAIRQVIRDPLNAWLTTGTDAVPVLSSMKELATMVAGRNETERKLMEMGAISSNVFSGDEADVAKFIKDIAAGKSMWAKTLAKADALAMQADAATRVVIYKDSIAKGMDEQAALIRTLESMNFGRRGVSPSMHMLSVLIPFFNAQIQGLDVIYRAFKGEMPYNEQLKIREKMLARGLMLAMGTLAYAAMMEDDEAYKRAKPQERFANWFVYVPGVSEPVRVPIPFELGFLFKALPEAVYGMAVGDEKAIATTKGLMALANQSNPFSLPQAIKPLTEVVLGKSFYSGDIESTREKEKLATERYRENSTEVAKLLGQVTGKAGVSPIQIDYLIRGYTGGLGIALVQLANPILAPNQKDIAQPSTKPSNLPFIGGLFQPTEGRGTLDEAYDRMTEIRQVKGSYNRLVEDGKLAEAREFAHNYANDLAQASVSGRVQKQLGEIAKQERIIRSHPTMTTEEKDRRLEQLDKVKIQIARQFLALPR